MMHSRQPYMLSEFREAHRTCGPRTLARGRCDDTAILQITLITSWFNYINRVADALGVGHD